MYSEVQDIQYLSQHVTSCRSRGILFMPLNMLLRSLTDFLSYISDVGAACFDGMVLMVGYIEGSIAWKY